jgi:hypothetical protein
MSFELANCTNHLLHEIADRTMKRRDVAQSYALAMRSSETTDWVQVNAAIIKRWSQSALVYIKEQAWSGQCWPARKE